MKKEYEIILLPTAQKHMDSLDKPLIKKMITKIKWLSKHPELLGRQPLSGLPAELKGLCKYRVGDYRIIYRVNHGEAILKIYGVKHRSQVYNDIGKKYKT